MIGGGFDGSYYYDPGNEYMISSLGDGTPIPGITSDTAVRVMKKLGATKVAAIGYGASPSSSETAKAVETFGADAVGLEGVYLNNALEFGSTDVGPIVLGIKNSGADGVYLPLDSNTNFSIIQSLQQNGVKTKANVLATGYSQDLLDQPIAEDDHAERRDAVELQADRARRAGDQDLREQPEEGRHHRRPELRGLHRVHHLRHGDPRPSRTQARTRPARASSTVFARRTAASTNPPV